MGLWAFLGDSTGSGKTSLMLQLGLYRANKYKKLLVTNFALNLDGLYVYCLLMRYYHILKLINSGGIFLIDCQTDMDFLLKIRNAVVLADEWGVLAFSRDHSSNSKQLIHDAALSRHAHIDLFYSAQYDGQVDNSYRRLTHRIYYCKGQCKENSDGDPMLIGVLWHRFSPPKFELWINNAKAKQHYWKTKLSYAEKTEKRGLSIEDKYLFNSYDSFGGIGKGSLGLSFSKGAYYRCKRIPSLKEVLGWRPFLNKKVYIANVDDFTDREIYLSIGRYNRRPLLSLAFILVGLFSFLPKDYESKIIEWADKLQAFLYPEWKGWRLHPSNISEFIRLGGKRSMESPIIRAGRFARECYSRSLSECLAQRSSDGIGSLLNQDELSLEQFSSRDNGLDNKSQSNSNRSTRHIRRIA